MGSISNLEICPSSHLIEILHSLILVLLMEDFKRKANSYSLVHLLTVTHSIHPSFTVKNVITLIPTSLSNGYFAFNINIFMNTEWPQNLGYRLPRSMKYYCTI